MGLDCRVIPNVIELEDYPYRERCQISPDLFWMRSFHPIWNPEMAVRVLSGLRACGVRATLVMGGSDKGSLAAVRRLCVDRGVSESVQLPGFLDRVGKAEAGNKADVFLNTNRVDNMPVAVVEACAMGLPVISTSVGGIPDLLSEGETGLLVPSDDADAMANAVLRLMGDPSLAAKLSRNGRRLAEESAWPNVRARWRKLFREMEVASAQHYR
jgi:glycosyltransferase involved in cell wall biosynthesis